MAKEATRECKSEITHSLLFVHQIVHSTRNHKCYIGVFTPRIVFAIIGGVRQQRYPFYFIVLYWVRYVFVQL